MQIAIIQIAQLPLQKIIEFILMFMHEVANVIYGDWLLAKAATYPFCMGNRRLVNGAGMYKGRLYKQGR